MAISAEGSDFELVGVRLLRRLIAFSKVWSWECGGCCQGLRGHAQDTVASYNNMYGWMTLAIGGSAKFSAELAGEAAGTGIGESRRSPPPGIQQPEPEAKGHHKLAARAATPAALLAAHVVSQLFGIVARSDSRRSSHYQLMGEV